MIQSYIYLCPYCDHKQVLHESASSEQRLCELCEAEGIKVRMTKLQVIAPDYCEDELPSIQKIYRKAKEWQ